MISIFQRSTEETNCVFNVVITDIKISILPAKKPTCLTGLQDDWNLCALSTLANKKNENSVCGRAELDTENMDKFIFNGEMKTKLCLKVEYIVLRYLVHHNKPERI